MGVGIDDMISRAETNPRGLAKNSVTVCYGPFAPGIGMIQRTPPHYVGPGRKGDCPNTENVFCTRA